MPNHIIPLRTQFLFDLTHTLARPRLEHTEYPWEILSDIPTVIREIGATLDPDRYDHPAEDIWIAKSATVAPTAYIVWQNLTNSMQIWLYNKKRAKQKA